MNRTASLIELGILVLSLVGIRRSSKRGASSLARLLKILGAANFLLVLSLHLATIASGPDNLETNGT